MRVLVLGKHGQVATALSQLSGEGDAEIVSFGRQELNLADLKHIYSRIMESGASAIVNAAAYTAVDKAETDAETAMKLNAEAPAVAARAARDLRVPFIHLSTDYVFSGEKTSPYVENDPISPTSVYGLSKAEGEMRVSEVYPAATILRTAWVFHESGNNFVKTMLRLGCERKEVRVVADQYGSPTYAGEIAAACMKIVDIARTEPTLAAGTFHFAGEGYATWYALAKAIFADAAARGWNVPQSVLPIRTSDYPTPAKRPANSRLDCSKIAAELGVEASPWRDSLKICLDRIAVPVR